MTMDFKNDLLRLFPPGNVLAYDEFIHVDRRGMGLWSHLYDYDDLIQWKAFEQIAHPWPEINWVNLAEIGSDGWMLPSFLNKKSFTTVFPSLLNFVIVLPSWPGGEEYGYAGMLRDVFLGTLNFEEIKDEWRREYYLSFDEEVKKIVRLILEKDGSWDAMNALNSYWGSV